jgi:hypothetical protein
MYAGDMWLLRECRLKEKAKRKVDRTIEQTKGEGKHRVER